MAVRCAAISPARMGAANELPLHTPKPAVKSSGSRVERTVLPYGSRRAGSLTSVSNSTLGEPAASVGGMVHRAGGGIVARGDDDRYAQLGQRPDRCEQ